MKSASLVDSLRVLLTGVVPALVRGLFSPRPRAMALLTRLDADRRAVETLSALKAKLGGEGAKLLGGRLVVVWGERALHEVLERSAWEYAADAGAKAKGMGHFQPDAVTLSRGEDWRDRRAFNEHVLGSPDASRLRAVAAEEVAQLSGDLDWAQWARLFDRITLRVVFGDAHRDDTELTQTLERLMGEANRLVGLSTGDDYHELYRGLERALIDPPPESLLARFADAPQTDRTRVTQQIPHWMFAMRDTLAANTFRALAAIVALGLYRDDAEHLDGCLQEAMRLWPTTPLLARETTEEVTLAGERLAEGTQVLILNTFNHRDTAAVPDADRFVPGRGRSIRFNHLSNGSQDCPGAPIVSILGVAVLAEVLRHHDLELLEPRLSEPLPHMLDFFAIRFAMRATARRNGARTAQLTPR
jgi:cytochrome P450